MAADAEKQGCNGITIVISAEGLSRKAVLPGKKQT